MNDTLLRRVLRTGAIVIALAAAIDPEITSTRSLRPDIAVLAVDAVADSQLARTVSERLARNFTVLRAPYAGAAATVLVGQHVPANVDALGTPLFVVTPDATSANAIVESLRVPAHVPFQARVPVVADVHVTGARGGTVDVELRANDIVVDRVSQPATGNDARVTVALSFVPTAAGIVPLRVTARVARAAGEASADAVVDVQQKQWAVLFFDPRPAWMSTFVRRAVERDARFVVTSRVVTSTNVSTDAGRPPATLDSPDVPELYDVVVVGAPESLGDRDVLGLEAFLRQRGGSVVLLFDETEGGRYERLADFGSWKRTTNSEATVIAGGTDSVAMRATEWMWPTVLPVGATVLAWSGARAPAPRDSTGMHPVVWMSTVGAGRLVASGALDAWKFRDAKLSAFEAFWQRTLGELANASPPALTLQLPAVPVQAGTVADIGVTSRGAALLEPTALRPVQAHVSAAIELPAGRGVVRVWPAGNAGTFRGTFRAPAVPGVYRVTAAAGGATVDGAVVVTGAPVPVSNPREPALLAAWATATGGRVLPASRSGELSTLLQQTVRGAARAVAWHPMHSAWWLAPFALALSAEWWLRRRRGLP